MLKLNFTDYQGGQVFNDNFPTVRLHNEEFVPGTICEVLVRRQSLGFAKIVSNRDFEFCKIRNNLSYLHYGMPPHYMAAVLKKFYETNTFKIVSETKFDHLILQYTERDIENQRTLITDWWKKTCKEVAKRSK